MPVISGGTWLFLLCIAIRATLSLLTCTLFQPDEYFQSLEPAHQAVYGFGALTWEWTIRPPLRSFVYPALFVPVYWLLRITSLDNTFLLIVLPKLVQGCIAAFADYYTYKLAVRLYGPQYGNAALFLSLTSVFNLLSLTRTLSNSTETSLAAAGLFYWPALAAEDCLHHDVRARFRIALCLAGLSVAIRPTSSIMWLWMFSLICYDTIRIRRPIFPLLTDTVVIGSITLLLLVGIDSAYYRQLTFTPVTFLVHNFFSANPISLFYGQNTWHFYVTQALPLLLNTATPFAIHTTWIILFRNGDSASRRLCGLVGWTMFMYSLAGHKEWRFLHPLLPELLLLVSKSVVDLNTRMVQKKVGHGTPEIPKNTLHISTRHITFLLLTLPLGVYLLRWHGRAQISVMFYLRSLDLANLRSVGFLMPCHSTPWQSYLHREQLEGNMWALGCEPPIGLSPGELASYQDQADVFYDAPVVYLSERFPMMVDPTFPPSPMPTSPPGMPWIQNWTHTWPSHLVAFGALIEDPNVRNTLAEKGYREAWVTTNGWEEDPRRRGGVKVWQWMPT
ncbi:glycosyltransferase family 22 protein [Dacryopinax primogenitus]|uniref:Mannosyltransferase n=1 Tax=Dacryopinax primogenitus (strain DJM 731) TaxID=1858805 RepID=M5G6I6_DACPD|nr:glycosyltransferase family 22 protein [Dacryopinax primogenitus]EJU04309.1 glycosyltransferase family 22 protein [Dacryopinax primogenitus]